MAIEQATTVQVEDLSIQQLDYYMYQHACELLEKRGSKKEFLEQYKLGHYHFLEDGSLLNDIISNYVINIQNLSGDWLASDTDSSAYGATPTEAACRLVIKNTFGSTLSI